MRIPYSKGLAIYSKTNPSMQRILGYFLKPIPRSAFLGSGFHFFFHELSRTQWFKPVELVELQNRRLRALVNHSYHNVPYYNRTFKQRKLRPEDIRSVEDLEKLPILTKDEVRNHFSELIAMNSGSYQYGINTTSGSTGKPLAFFLDQQNREIEYASKWRQRGWANVGFNSKIATCRAFRGNLNWTDFRTGKPCWKFNMLSKELEFNIFGLNRSIVQKQITKLRKFRPCLIEGFPSTIELWAKYVLEQNIKDISPAMVQTSSETLSTLQRTVIEQAFNCKVRDWYGQSEYVVSVGECPQGSYHINESGILEVLKDGERASDGQIGEIVGTGLYNYSMPFIRYRTTDLGQSSNDECSCGRGLPLVRSLEGRISDSIVASDGRLITGASFEHYWKVRITRHTPDIDYVHVIQQSNRNLLIQIVKKKGYSEKETQVILRELNTLLGYEIEIKFEELDSVPIRRKWRFSESELPLSLI